MIGLAFGSMLSVTGVAFAVLYEPLQTATNPVEIVPETSIASNTASPSSVTDSSEQEDLKKKPESKDEDEPSTIESSIDSDSVVPSEALGAENEPATTVTPATVGSTQDWSLNRLAGQTLFIGPHNPAATTATSVRSTKPADAAAFDIIAKTAKGIWLMPSLYNSVGYVSQISASAASAGQVPVYVLYGMRSVACADGNTGASAVSYKNWVKSLNSAMGSTKSVVIIEPDELALDYCGSDYTTKRRRLISEVIGLLQKSNLELYVDIGHGSWLSVTEAAAILNEVGVQATNGFSLNVSNFTTTAVNTSFGDALSASLGGAHYVIDTSRNGKGPNEAHEWCNPSGRALGERSKTLGSSSKLDAYIWIKYPGESDGTCNGGPSEGQWWPEYALGLAKQAGY